MWADAIKKEMPKIIAAVDEHEGNVNDLVGYQEITGHMIFDVKLGENFCRKARYVANGHKTDTPASVTYSTVVSRDLVRICLTFAAVNDLEILSGDIENAYLLAPCREKVWLRAGPEFRHLEAKIMIVRKALYGLKSSGAAFCAHLEETLNSIGFKNSLTDPNVWMRPGTKASGEKYYEYILCYVDDIPCISHDAQCPMDEIRRNLKYKNNKIVEPEFYVGAMLKKKKLNGHNVWMMTSQEYLCNTIKTVEAHLSKKGRKLPVRAMTLMSSGYYSEVDSSPELDANDTTLFQELIGILRWAVEIGRVNILTELSMLSSHQACPREGHLEEIYHIFMLLKRHPKLTLYSDPQAPFIDPSWFEGDDAQTFFDQYRDAEEQLPDDHLCPEPHGVSVSTTAYANSSHAANKITQKESYRVHDLP